MRIRSWHRLQLGELSSSQISMICLAGAVAASIITVYVDPVVGMIIYAAELWGLIILGALDANDTRRAFLLSIALVPISQIVALSLPDDALPEEWQFLLTYVPLLGAATMAARATGLTRQDVHLQLPDGLMWLPAVFTAGSGIPIGFVAYEYSLLRPPGTSALFDAEEFVAASLVLALVAGLAEEVVFRGIIQAVTVNRMLGATAGIVFVGVLYGSLYISHRSDAGLEYVARDVLFAFSVGIYFAASTFWTRSLLGAIVAHSLITATLLVGIPLFWE